MRKLLLAFLTVLTPNTIQAQAKKSERATVSQVVNGTTITVEYYRPVVRGRTELFGKQVHWGEIWTPGANWATTLEVDRDVFLNGHAVPKGKYSVWMVTAKDSAWTFFLNKNARRFHTNRPQDTSEDVVRFKVQPVAAASMEALLWYFPSVQRDTATLHMHWSTTLVALQLLTTPLPRLVMTPSQRQSLVGEYQIFRTMSKDTAKSIVSEEGGKLFYTASAGTPNSSKSELVAVAENTFRRLQKMDGNEELGDIVYAFTKHPDGSVTFEVTMPETKELVARGTRIK